MCRITGLVDLDLLTGFAAYVHRRTAFPLVLLDVIAELRIHEWFFVGLTAFLLIFRPEELLVYSVAEQFLLDVVEVCRPLLCGSSDFLGKQ